MSYLLLGEGRVVRRLVEGLHLDGGKDEVGVDGGGGRGIEGRGLGGLVEAGEGVAVGVAGRVGAGGLALARVQDALARVDLDPDVQFEVDGGRVRELTVGVRLISR